VASDLVALLPAAFSFLLYKEEILHRICRDIYKLYFEVAVDMARILDLCHCNGIH